MRVGSFIFFQYQFIYDVGLFAGFFKHPKMSQLRNQSHFFSSYFFYRLSEFFHQTGEELFHHFLGVHAISSISPAENHAFEDVVDIGSQFQFFLQSLGRIKQVDLSSNILYRIIYEPKSLRVSLVMTFNR